MQRSFRIPVVAAASLAGALAAGVLALPAMAATSSPSTAGTQFAVTSAASSVAKLPISARQLLVDRQRRVAAQQLAGIVTGMVRSSAGRPLLDVCVTAFGPSGDKFAATKADGTFVLAGLHPGKYDLEYRSCGGATSYLTAWYGGSAVRGSSRPVLVTGVGVNEVAPMTLRPAPTAFGRAKELAGLGGAATASPRSMGRLILGPVSSDGATPQLRTASPSSRNGRIAGTVAGPSGHGLKGICVEAVQINGGYGGFAATSKSGHFRVLGLPAGRYEVAFFARCGNRGNWLAEIYNDKYTYKKPTLIRVRAGKTTAGIDATMTLGGEISGVITNAAGKRLAKICVEPVDVTNRRALVLSTVSARGAYHLRGMPPGSYRIAFLPCQSSSAYAPTWLGGTVSEAASRLVRVKGVQRVQHIDQVMPIGGVVTGTVTGATSPTPTPLGGICVYVLARHGGLGYGGFATTNKAGKYSVKGLPTGAYRVQFQLGCPNNGNYLSANYPGSVNVVEGKTRSGINGVLPVGAIVAGTVTSKATGTGLGGICVVLSVGANGLYGYETQTFSDGSYAISQLAAGKYTVQFSSGCGSRGSYAPQAFNGANPATPTIFTLSAGQTQTANAAMQPGATIAGTVTSNTGKPLRGICAVAFSTEGFLISIAATNSTGHYRAGSLAPDTYGVSFVAGCGNKQNLTSQSFGPQASGAVISVTAGATNGINGVLSPAGTISGLLKTKTGKSVRGGCELVTGEAGPARSVRGGTYGSEGNRFRLTHLPAGSYLVEFEPGCGASKFENQWYSGKASPAGATLVRVRARHTTTGIDSAVVVGGSITGRITSRGKAVDGACVYAQSVTQLSDYGFGLSGKDGRYVLHGLNSGRYELQLSPCFGSSRLANVVAPRLVTVKAPATTSGANASVPVAGTMSGTVLGGTPARAQDGTCVEAFAVNGLSVGFGNTGPDGAFRLTNLAPGEYLIYLGDPSCDSEPQALAPQWYDHKPTQRTATHVTVTAGTDVTIGTATLASDGAISGNVTGAGSSPLVGACVAAYPTGQGASLYTSGPVYTDSAADGSYSIANLTPGTYKVQFTSGCGATGYRAQWWRNVASMRKAKAVTVAAGATTASVNAAMTK